MVQQVRELTGGGVQHSFEVLGRKETAEQSFAMLAAGGTATIVGMIPFGQKIELHGFDFLRERRIQGSSMGSNHFRVDMPRLIEFYMRGKLHLEDWISAKLKLSEINEGFANMKAGKTLRSVIMFDAEAASFRAMRSIEPGISTCDAARIPGSALPGCAGMTRLTHRDTCAETASHLPFCFAQQSV